MVAKAAVRITERIPHTTVSYAYLELEAASVNEFESLRKEALAAESLSHYAFARNAPAGPTADAPAGVVPPPDETGAGDAGTTDEDAAAGAYEEPTASAPPTETPADKAKAKIAAASGAPTAPSPDVAAPSTEGLSPREIARARLLAKKEGK